MQHLVPRGLKIASTDFLYEQYADLYDARQIIPLKHLGCNEIYDRIVADLMRELDARRAPMYRVGV